MFSSCKGSKNENKVKIKRDQSVNGKPIEREKSLLHVAMVAKFLDLYKLYISARMAGKMTFLCMIALRNKTVAYTILPSFDNAIVRPCLERFLRPRNYDPMITWRYTSFLYNSELTLDVLVLKDQSLFQWQHYTLTLSLFATQNSMNSVTLFVFQLFFPTQWQHRST